MPDTTNVTLLLDQAAAGSGNASNKLFEVVYDELKRMAEWQMKSERQDITLQSTAIVHEVWIKLIGNRDQQGWNNRKHFFAAAARAMRRILVDSARSRKRIKRGGGLAKVELQDADLISQQDDELLALHEALELLAIEDARKAELVSLRYFGGLTNAQAAKQLDVSIATAERDWTFAKAWLRAKMESE
jgi:RNA polymerase sigma factor (TIGR02999 family)